MHQSAWVLAPLTLVAVLAFSASTKIGKGESLRKIVRNLRLSDRILPVPLARAIPWIELAIAVGLLTPWRWTFAAAAAGAAVLMVVYWLLIARGMTLTPRPMCGCFGQAGDHGISWRTLLRNTLLVAAAVASVALAWTGRTGWSAVSAFTSGDWLWLALAAVASVVTALVLGSFGPAPESPASDPVSPTKAESGERIPGGDAQGAADDDGDYVREPIPRAVLIDDGTPVTLRELAAERAQLLVLVDCYCASTQEITPHIAGWDERLDLVDVRTVFAVPYKSEYLRTPVENPLLDHAKLTWDTLGVEYSPAAVLLGADGLLAGGPVSGVEEVTQFVADVEAQLSEGDPEVVDSDSPPSTDRP
ncbi:MauE/DoxX family redox-associated membrane protein [Knoellia subterranea]|uniref:Methylamine utilization protein MauE n=1 Tax=Knoellia subterranea KCTC 19937 TaxID=1385521 RepID=A0A0A0JNX9_9MICO|nr:MauE/DoxX family redox-associated membrane protein [Knoellia subterranea]KGN39110.1 methylamine utilization protein MauE [Knoellia subterranea KCTC 19937]